MNSPVSRHVEGSDPPRFRLLRLRDGRQAGLSVAAVSPVGFAVEGRPLWPLRLTTILTALGAGE